MYLVQHGRALRLWLLIIGSWCVTDDVMAIWGDAKRDSKQASGSDAGVIARLVGSSHRVNYRHPIEEDTVLRRFVGACGAMDYIHDASDGGRDRRRVARCEFRACGTDHRVTPDLWQNDGDFGEQVHRASTFLPT